MTEAKMQAEIVKYLQSEGVFSHSIPNEAYGRSVVAQMQLVSMGMRPGAADLVVWFPATPKGEGVTVGYLEVKTAKGKQSPSQVKFQKRCEKAGVFYAVVRSVEDVEKILRRRW